MKNLLLAVSLIASFSLLSSCQHSPQKHYFLLNAPANISTSASNQPASGNITRSIGIDTIGIGPVVVADYLDRLAIVRTQGDNSLQISDTDYWGEPLDKGITRVLADTLRQRNPSIGIVQFPYRSDARPSHGLRVQIHNLNYNGSQASIEATWELIDNINKKVIARKNFTQTHTSAAGPSDIAKAYSILLVKLEDDIQTEIEKR